MLTQEEANNLINMVKKIEKPGKLKFPHPGEKKEISVISLDGKEKFFLDINRARLKLTKCTYQNRYRRDIILLRLDIDGPDHTNPEPNGETFPCPHLHIFKEGYGDKFAIPLPLEFSPSMDLITKLYEFLDYCKIDNANEMQIQGVI